MVASKIRAGLARQINREIESISEGVIQSLQHGPDSESPRRREHIAEFALQTVPYYKKLSASTFEDFPVITKAEMVKGGRQFLSTALDLTETKKVTTSGSTGVPFTAYWDDQKVRHHQGALLGTYRFQDTDPFGARVMTKAWVNQTRTQRLTTLLKGELPHSGGSVMWPSAKTVERYIRLNRGASIIGYSSYVEQLVRALEAADWPLESPQIKSVVGTSEPPSAYLKEAVPRLFGIPLRMRYSNVENGILAVTSSSEERYAIDSTSFFIEVLDQECDSPSPLGEVGRIVVTDLHNKAMPFIRYDTGDLGALSGPSSSPPHHLTKLAGRRLDRIILGLDPSPRYAHALQIWAPTSKLAEVRQFQLRQHDIGVFTWILNADRSNALENNLRAILDNRVGDIIACRFEYVDEVPVMASGKRQFFVNEMSLG